jgi:hypothetical protein
MAINNPKFLLIPSGKKAGKLYSVLPESGVGDFTFTRATEGIFTNKYGYLETAPIDVPRLDYRGTGGSLLKCPVLLLEPLRTNLVKQSEDFSNAYWTKSGSSITSNVVISPDGTLSADKLVEDTSTGSHYAFISSVFTTSSINNTITLSVFAKKGGRDINLESYASGGGENPKVNFDLTNVTASLVAGTATFSIESFGADWYRCSITYTVSQSGSNVQAYIILLNGINVDYTGDGTSGVYIWGAQLEQGSYATSYIPTSGSTKTRFRDIANGAGDASTFNDSEGVLMMEISALSDDGTSRRISLSDGSISNRVSLEFDETTNTLKLFINSSVLIANGITLTNSTKIIAKYKANDYALWVNGFEVELYQQQAVLF